MKLSIPGEMLEDEEMRNTHEDYKELTNEFESTHLHLVNNRKDSTNPKELEKKITQLDSEKEQLLSRIAIFKKKNNTPEFQ